MKALFLSALLSLPALAHTSFFPHNDLFIPVDSKMAKGITETQFHAIIDKIENHYAPIVATFGHPLVVERLWKNGKVNAEAEQFPEKWVIRMFGGMARSGSMTEDAFALVMCHELGHHIGGSPKFKEKLPWATNEGQSDYFAATKCLRRIWNDEDNIKKVSALKISAALIKVCDIWKNENEKALCQRTGKAGQVITEMLAFMGRKPAPWIERPDRSEVSETYDWHNNPQCRLDTFIQGALCEKSYQEDLSFDSEVTGTCHSFYGDLVGLRPRCWYLPQASY